MSGRLRGAELNHRGPAPRRGSLSVDVVLDEGHAALWDFVPDPEVAVAAAARALATHEGLDLGATEAVLALSSDADVALLNGTYRGQAKPTNVLSFPARVPTPKGAPRFLGDVILAAETVATEARDLGIPPTHHLQHLTVHGLLHLLGYDHETDDEASHMEALETAILARLGIADPYAT
jgi:probable rRNA maturation factor